MTDKDISAAANTGLAKVSSLEKNVPKALATLWREVVDLTRLTVDYSNGKYRSIPFKSVAAIAAAILYFVSPIDVIPDFIPVIGYVDDAAVIALCMKMVGVDVEAYREWKSKQS